MIRKGILILLTVASLGTGILGASSWWRDWTWSADKGNYNEDTEIWLLDRFIAKQDPLELEQYYASWRVYVGMKRGEFRATWAYNFPYIYPPPLPAYGFHWWRHGGFYFRHRVIRFTGDLAPTTSEADVIGGHRYLSLSGPVWLCVAPFAAYPAIVFLYRPVRRRWRRRFSLRYRLEHGLCFNCRYNLTGNVSGVCPECGTSIVPGRPDDPPPR